ncbi:hypothetical protein ACJZ2D_016078 [Fusarium nematophilum]
MAIRKVSKGETVRQTLLSELTIKSANLNATVKVLELNAEDHASVRNFASIFTAMFTDLYLIIANTGIKVQHPILRAEGKPDDSLRKLDEAISYGTRAAETTLEADPARGERYKNLAQMLASKYLLTEEDDYSVQSKKHFAYRSRHYSLSSQDAASSPISSRARLAEVSKQLNTAGAYQQARAHQQALLHELAAKEAEIRQLEGFEFFQLPPTEDQIKDITKDGPLIAVNVTNVRCDAIVVTKEGIRLVKLKNMTFEDLEEKIAIFQTLGNESRRNAVPRKKTKKKGLESEALIWLWDVAVRPILDVTELTPSRRVCRVISSYASSIKTLWYGRRNSLSPGVSRSMLLVTMRDNPSPHHDLVTEHEESAVKNIFGNAMKHLPQPDPKTVLRNLPGHSFVHFACHGTSIAYNPSQSGLLLVKDGKAVMLTIADLEKTDLKRGAVAYLSACSTAEQPDGKLADEAIHLANAFQTLGFQHVIGTMWGASDAAAGEVAKRFYERLTSKVSGLLMGSREVAEALHDSMVGYKEAATLEGRNVLDWGPFIHLGV